MNKSTKRKDVPQIKRVYDSSSKNDGLRVLVDRLWPRGISKEEACIDLWLKELTPSNDLRKWYHEDKGNRYEEFCKKYTIELAKQKQVKADLLATNKKFTIVTSVKEIEKSHIPVLIDFLTKGEAKS